LGAKIIFISVSGGILCTSKGEIWWFRFRASW
jgi:hypothetical protein